VIPGEQPIGKPRLVKEVKRLLTAVSHSGDPRPFWGEGWGEGAKRLVIAISPHQTRWWSARSLKEIDQ